MLSLRLATQQDENALIELCWEMERHYRGALTIPRAIAAKRIGDALWEMPRKSEALLAFWQDVPAGIALFHSTFPCVDLRPGFYMKDLFVCEAYRGRGIGRALLLELAGITRARGYERLQWSTHLDNEAAQKLYRSIGAELTQVFSCNLSGTALLKAAGS